MSVEKPIPKEPLQQITAGVNSAIDQSEFITVNCNLFKALESSRVQGATSFGFCSSLVEKLASQQA